MIYPLDFPLHTDPSAILQQPEFLGRFNCNKRSEWSTSGTWPNVPACALGVNADYGICQELWDRIKTIHQEQKNTPKKNLSPRASKKLGVRYLHLQARLGVLMESHAKAMYFLHFIYSHQFDYLKHKKYLLYNKEYHAVYWLQRGKRSFLGIALAKGLPSHDTEKYGQIALDFLSLKLRFMNCVSLHASTDTQLINKVDTYWQRYLKKEPHTLHLLDHFKTGTESFDQRISIYKYYDIGNLYDFLMRLQNKRCLLDKKALYSIGGMIVRQVARLHKQGIVHRNITLKNILLKSSCKSIYHVVLMHFTMSSLKNGSLSDLSKSKKWLNQLQQVKSWQNGVVGNILYLAPELLKEWNVDPQESNKARWLAGDVWALGCVLKYLFQSHLPHALVQWIEDAIDCLLKGKLLQRDHFEFYGDICSDDVEKAYATYTDRQRYQSLEKLCSDDPIAHLIWRCLAIDSERRIKSPEVWSCFKNFILQPQENATTVGEAN